MARPASSCSVRQVKAPSGVVGVIVDRHDIADSFLWGAGRPAAGADAAEAATDPALGTVLWRNESPILDAGGAWPAPPSPAVTRLRVWYAKIAGIGVL